ncbi:Fic family protein [bacterium]|nr:Fic family protein [bacterium]
MYIHQLNDWPKFKWSTEALAQPLAALRHEQGRLIGRMESLGFKLRQEANFLTLTEDVLTTSAIEGQILDPDAVRSSLAQRLGIEIAALKPSDREVDGVVEMLLDATQNFNAPLTPSRLFAWHAALFPTDISRMFPVHLGAWRDDASGPMQVVSGAIGREKVHFEAPSAVLLDIEMTAFIDWFETVSEIDPVLKSGLAHLWFITIHPFDDGNGRIARAIADLSLARSENLSERFYSMSAQIRLERKAYYDILERTQQGSLDVTPWLEWYFACLGRAIAGAQRVHESVIRKARFWESVSSNSTNSANSTGSNNSASQINQRQINVLNKLLNGFEGKLTSSKWAKLAKCSQDTAHRDIIDLVERGILKQDAAGGRSTSYSLVEENCDPSL